MYRKIDNHKSTATVQQGTVTQMYDDGWEDILDCRYSFASDADAIAHLLNTGWEEFDPNASLKAKGFVWNGYCYAMPENRESHS